LEKKDKEIKSMLKDPKKLEELNHQADLEIMRDKLERAKRGLD
jgi:hypothetical protein